LEKWGWKWWYYTRTNKSESYKVYCRASYTGDDNVEFEWDGSAESPVLAGEERYLDVNLLCARDKSYCTVSSPTVTRSQRLLAYMPNVTGDEIYCYSLIVKDLETGDAIVPTLS